MENTDERLDMIDSVLHRIERKYAQDAAVNEVCALAALCLLARKGAGGGDGRDLGAVLGECGITEAQREAIIGAVGGHWQEYGEVAGRFPEDDLVDLFERRYVRTLREKARNSPSMDALSLELLGIKAGESCLDICAGAGFFVNEAWMAMSHLARGGEVRLAGIESNPELARYAAVLSAIRGTGGRIDVADCFDPRHLREKYDKVHCTTPFGLNVRQLDFANVRKTVALSFPGFPPITLTSADWLFAARAVAALKEGGKAVVIMPRAALSGAQSAPYRRYFLANRWIESVIAFPEGAYPGTAIAVAAVVFAKGSSSAKLFGPAPVDYYAKGDPTAFNHVRMARDLALLCNYGNVVTKPVQEILARDGDLDPAAHLAGPLPYASGKTLGELCKTIGRGAVLPKGVLAALRPPSGREWALGYLTPKNISDGLVDADLPEFPETPPGAESAIAGPGDVVITRSGPAFKVAVVERRPCVADGNLVVCRPGDADPHYLMAFLLDAEGAKWLRRMSSGLQHTLSIRKLARIPVPAVPPETERRIALEMKRRLEHIRFLRRKLKENLAKAGEVFAAGMAEEEGGTGDGD